LFRALGASIERAGAFFFTGDAGAHIFDLFMLLLAFFSFSPFCFEMGGSGNRLVLVGDLIVFQD
jgi:hypothetical protein